MNIADYEWLEQVSAKKLSSSSLVSITKFARHVRRLNGRILGLRDPLLFRNMVEEMIITGDETLVSIFNKLMVEVKSVALKDGVEVPKHLLDEPKLNQNKNLTYRGVQVK